MIISYNHIKFFIVNKFKICSCECTYIIVVHSTITGDFSKGVTPVLIPNTEVKTFSAEHTCLETSREPRSLPVFQLSISIEMLFFV